MRRISRMRRPSGLRCLSSGPSTAPLHTQCRTAPAAVAPLSISMPNSTARRTRPASISRLFYSTQDTATSSKLPGSLTIHDELRPELDPENWEDVPEPVYSQPPPRTRAQGPDEVSDPSYIPATSEDGLERVGGLTGWWDRGDNWAPDGDFVSFRARKKVQDLDVLTAVVRRAVTEALVLKQLGREDALVGVWPIGDAGALKRVLALELNNGSGTVTLGGNFENVAEDLRWKDDEPVSEDEEEYQFDSNGYLVIPVPSAAEAKAQVESWNPDWTHVELTDPKMKFAVVKRLFQLTGQLIADHKLQNIKDVSSLLGELSRPKPLKTLTQEIVERKQDLVQLPNVNFSPKRVTKGAKDKSLGRFKLIEKELAARDLLIDKPIPKSREADWLRGKA